MSTSFVPRILLTRDFLRAGDRKTLSLLSARGEVVRVGHGAYVPTDDWSRMDADHRFRTVIRAASYLFPGAGPYSHLSAAALLRFPNPDPSPVRAEAIAPQNGSTRAVRGLLRHLAEVPDATMLVDGLEVTLPARTVVDVARTARPRVGLVMADHALARPDLGVTRDDLLGELHRLGSSAGFRRAARIVGFADGRSGSPGESVSRLCIWSLGAPTPVLQHRFVDEAGLVGVVDFWWPEYDLIGEFDGRMKYLRDEFLQGRTAGEVVVEEKRREDRLRSLGPRVVRWGWTEATHPELLRRVLVNAGLPLVRRPNSRDLPEEPRSAA